MNNEKTFMFTREIHRGTLETVIAFSPFKIKDREIKVLEAGFKHIPQKKGYMLAYIILDSNDGEVESYYLDILQERKII